MLDKCWNYAWSMPESCQPSVSWLETVLTNCPGRWFHASEMSESSHSSVASSEPCLRCGERCGYLGFCRRTPVNVKQRRQWHQWSRSPDQQPLWMFMCFLKEHEMQWCRIPVVNSLPYIDIFQARIAFGRLQRNGCHIWMWWIVWHVQYIFDQLIYPMALALSNATRHVFSLYHSISSFVLKPSITHSTFEFLLTASTHVAWSRRGLHSVDRVVE